MSSAWFKPVIPAIVWLQTDVLDHMATGIICPVILSITACCWLEWLPCAVHQAERMVIDSQHNQIARMLITVERGIKKHSCNICVFNVKTDWQGYRAIVCWYFIFCYLSYFITVAENYPTVERSALVFCCKQCAFFRPPWWWNVHFVQQKSSASNYDSSCTGTSSLVWDFRHLIFDTRWWHRKVLS